MPRAGARRRWGGLALQPEAHKRRLPRDHASPGRRCGSLPGEHGVHAVHAGHGEPAQGAGVQREDLQVHAPVAGACRAPWRRAGGAQAARAAQRLRALHSASGVACRRLGHRGGWPAGPPAAAGVPQGAAGLRAGLQQLAAQRGGSRSERPAEGGALRPCEQRRHTHRRRRLCWRCRSVRGGGMHGRHARRRPPGRPFHSQLPGVWDEGGRVCRALGCA